MLGFLDSDKQRHGHSVHGLFVLGDVQWLASHPDTYVVVAVGNPVFKRKIVCELKAIGHERFATLVHPGAIIGDYVQVGEGTIICAGSIITTDIRIGNHVTINYNCTIGHDSTIEDYATILPSASISGNVIVEEGCQIGTGSQVIQGLTIGRWSIVGAGAVVVRDIPRNVTAVGVPAKPIKERPEGWHLT